MLQVDYLKQYLQEFVEELDVENDCPERAGETLSNPAKMIVMEKVLEEVS